MRKKGFTLIELLVVIAIIGILALLIILNLASAAERARFSKAKGELKTIDDAVTIAFTDGQKQPVNTSWDFLATVDTATEYSINNIVDNQGQNLIQAVPSKPQDNTDWSRYMVYINGSTDHAAGINTPKDGDNICIFKGGSMYEGTVSGKTGTKAACGE